VIVHTPDADRAAALLDGQVEHRDGDELIVRPGTAESATVNARLVAAGVRVSQIVPERRSLEEVVLAVTGSGSDRVDRADRADRADRVDRVDPRPGASDGQPDGAGGPGGAP
jgi:hypothetical protein